MSELTLFNSPEAGWADFNADLLYCKGNVGENKLRASYICPITRPLFKFFISILADDATFYDKYRLVEFDAEGWTWYLGYADNNLFLMIDNINEHTYNSMPFVCHSFKNGIRPVDLAEAWLNTYKQDSDAWLGWDYSYSKASKIFTESLYTEDEIKDYSNNIELTKSYARTLEELIKKYRG